RQAGGGSIINISSVAGRMGVPMRTPYAATKWGVVGLTRSLAVELGGYGIRVNALLPGLVAGPRIDRVIEARARNMGVTVAE
ncbi:SDR family NAD(P)-dependent oxidoreductase, partial [Achromobacter xylosoxidans]